MKLDPITALKKNRKVKNNAIGISVCDCIVLAHYRGQRPRKLAHDPKVNQCPVNLRTK